MSIPAGWVLQEYDDDASHLDPAEAARLILLGGPSTENMTPEELEGIEIRYYLAHHDMKTLEEMAQLVAEV